MSRKRERRQLEEERERVRALLPALSENERIILARLREGPQPLGPSLAVTALLREDLIEEVSRPSAQTFVCRLSPDAAEVIQQHLD